MLFTACVCVSVHVCLCAHMRVRTYVCVHVRTLCSFTLNITFAVAAVTDQMTKITDLPEETFVISWNHRSDTVLQHF